MKGYLGDELVDDGAGAGHVEREVGHVGQETLEALAHLALTHHLGTSTM